MRILICPNEEVLNRQATTAIADLLHVNPRAAFTFATGGTPVGAYRELVRLSREGSLDFSLASTFHLDEYCGVGKGHPQSY